VALTVKPGDTIAAEVSVTANVVTLSLTDGTQTAAEQVTLTSNLDVSSAEWIAEAPSQCSGRSLGRCTVLPLANFGTVSFTGASATVGTAVGTISNAAWTSQGIQLGRSATPSALSADGSGFSVAYAAPTAPTVTPPTTGRSGWGWGWGRGRRHAGR
jgi:hypothetical protein